MLTSICINTFNRPAWLTKTLQGIAQYAQMPYEIIVVDDCSPNPEVGLLLEMFQKKFADHAIPFKALKNPHNMKAARSANMAMQAACGDVIIHLEDDIIIPTQGWNLAMGGMFQMCPEVGQVVPEGNGRGEWIPRPRYNEFSWGLGGVFAVRKEVVNRVGLWDSTLVHQIEPDYNLRVRMAGWRVAEISGIRMVHLGEGDQDDTFRKQAMVNCGVHTMLMKWNRRFQGMWDYDSVWAMSWDDFPPNVNFRRQLASYFASEAEKLADKYRGLGALKDDQHYVGSIPEEVKKQHAELARCRINSSAEPFQFPGHWGRYELVNVIRPVGREREPELINLMKNGYAFGDVYRLPKALTDLAKRMNYNLTVEELNSILSSVPRDYVWEAQAVYQ